MVQGHNQHGSRRFPSNRGKHHNPNRIQKNGQEDRDADTPMRNSPMNGRSHERGNRGRGHFLNNRNDRRRPEDIQRAVNKGVVVVQDYTGGNLPVGGALEKSTGNLSRISVRGWVTSKAGTAADRGAQSVLNFLVRKTTPTRGPESRRSIIQKSEIDGDNLIIFVRAEDTNKLLRLNNYSFAGAVLDIKLLSSASSVETQPTSQVMSNAPISQVMSDAAILRQKMTEMIARRYNLEMKLLDLSALRNDVEFANTELFATPSRQSKFFPALMKVCDGLFTSSEQKTESVLGVSLANNTLSNVAPVTTLSQTFPGIEFLDMSNNSLSSVAALEGWRHKFRSLDSLILTGNPLEIAEPDYKMEILKWFPRLRYLNNEEVRSIEEVAIASKSKIRMPIYNPNFRDEAMIGENFVRSFFVGYDTDRGAAATAWYDAESSFSLSINVSALRAPGKPDAKISPWDAYIKKSRNLTKVTALHARMDRMYRGVQKIRQLWLTLPVTRHADMLAEPHRWCIECHSIPGLPDPTGRSPNGVGGLIVMVHGEFDELDALAGTSTAQRSFDRTFVLGPGGGIGGIRVVSDLLIVRAYGGIAAWKPDVDVLLMQTTPQFASPEGFGIAVPGKLEEQVQKELIALELTKATRMTLGYSGMCLEESAWDLQAALKAFEGVKTTLPPEAFI